MKTLNQIKPNNTIIKWEYRAFVINLAKVFRFPYGRVLRIKIKKPAEIKSCRSLCFLARKQKGKGRGETGGELMGKCKSSPCFETTKLRISCSIKLLCSMIKNIYMISLFFGLVFFCFIIFFLCGRIVTSE